MSPLNSVYRVIVVFIAFFNIGILAHCEESRKVAVTIDDGPAVDASDLQSFQNIASALRQTFVTEKVPAIMFINEQQIDVPGETRQRLKVLEEWLDAGLALGNHTYSHCRLRDTPLKEYLKEIVKGEKFTRALLDERKQELVWFRYPYLSSGSGKLAESVEKFLQELDYRIAPVTVDYKDYRFAGNFRRFQRAGETEQAEQVVKESMESLDLAFDRAEANAQQFAGRPISLILLIHCNTMNAEHLKEALQRIRERGYEFVSLEEAMEDPIYKKSGLPAGTLGGSFFGGLDAQTARSKQ